MNLSPLAVLPWCASARETRHRSSELTKLRGASENFTLSPFRYASLSSHPLKSERLQLANKLVGNMKGSHLLPRFEASAKLFVTGATIGPVVDSLHNQCLLTYDMATISLEWPSIVANAVSTNADPFFCSSWTVPPLLGIAYVVLGGVLPRFFQTFLDGSRSGSSILSISLKAKAVLAVTTTALIIKLSEFLETHPHALEALPWQSSTEAGNLLVMVAAAALQWITLDGTPSALFAATLAGVGGPLSELPFVAHGFWHYLPGAADYLPLQDIADASTPIGRLAEWILGGNYRDLALSSITGPCYFAVTMDAIALGRWFDSSED